jgi:serine/threonine protein kinase/tetratricopeptide (TPR) repeat protein
MSEGLPIGACVGRYQILGAIGRGGMGEVYAAYHPDLDRRIALKIVGESGADTEERRARLLREARAIARLSHPNVVAVYDAGTVGEQVYIAMELVEGTTADVWLAAARRTWREVLDVFVAAGRGLVAAHAAEIVHRDFKPQNIMIGRDGSVRVMDFGLARLPGNDHGPPALPSALDAQPRAPALPTATVTKTGALLGTPAYMAPEQFRGERADARADQYSFCVSLHEALYGVRPRLTHLPTANASPSSMRDAPPSRGRAGVPVWLKHTIERGLSADRDRRFPSMSELLRVLERGTTRRRRRVTALLGGLALTMIAVAGWRLSTQRQFDCSPPAHRLDSLWTANDAAGSRRESVRRALLASGHRDAPAVWTRLSSALDQQVARWATMYRQTCEATHVRGEQSEQVLDLRMSCLATRLDEVRALTDILVTADTRAVGQAVAAAGDLTPIDRCADIEALRATVPLPGDERTRRSVEALKKRVNDVRALRDVGQLNAAREKATALRHEVEQTRYPPLLAELLTTLGIADMESGDLAGAEVVLKQAVVAADAGRDDSVRVDAASILVADVGIQGRFEESRLWAEIAYAILDRLGPGHSRERAWVLQDQGFVFERAGQLQAARGALERCVALKEQTLGPDHPDVAIGLLSLGNVRMELGELEPALAAEDRALAIWTAQGNTAGAAKARNNRAEILTAMGRYDDARESFQRAVRDFEQALGEDNVFVAAPLTGLGELELVAGRPAAAVPQFERALKLREGREREPFFVAATRFGLARALWELGTDRTRALALGRAARDAFAAMHNSGALQKVDTWLASRAAHKHRARPNLARG